MRLLIFFWAIWVFYPADAIAQFGQKPQVPQKKEENKDNKRKQEITVIHPPKPVPDLIRTNRPAPECPCTIIKVEGKIYQSTKLLKEKDKISNWKHIKFGSAKDYADVLDRLKQGHRVSEKPQTKSNISNFATYQTGNDIQLDFKSIPYPISVSMLNDSDEDPMRTATLQPAKEFEEEPVSTAPATYSYHEPVQYKYSPSTAKPNVSKTDIVPILPLKLSETKASRSVTSVKQKPFMLLFPYSPLEGTVPRPATYSQSSKFTLLFRYKQSGE